MRCICYRRPVLCRYFVKRFTVRGTHNETDSLLYLLPSFLRSFLSFFPYLFLSFSTYISHCSFFLSFFPFPSLHSFRSFFPACLKSSFLSWFLSLYFSPFLPPFLSFLLSLLPAFNLFLSLFPSLPFYPFFPFSSSWRLSAFLPLLDKRCFVSVQLGLRRTITWCDTCARIACSSCGHGVVQGMTENRGWTLCHPLNISGPDLNKCPSG